jgi:hypothetical protein
MSVFKRRSKMISFRLSEQEYQSLLELCAADGVRSLSDLARDAMHRVLSANGNGHKPQAVPEGADVQHLHGRMMQLEGEIRRLAGMMEQSQRSEVVSRGEAI